LREWIKVAADRDPEAFEKRLAFDKLNIDQARQLLGTIPAASELPAWTYVLNEVLLRVTELHESLFSPDLLARCGFVSAEKPVPFEELLVPFVEVARARIVAASRGQFSRLPIEVRADFERALLKRLSELSARVLLVEFRTFLASSQLAGRRPIGSAVRAQSRENYLRFIEETYANGWAGLFGEYPVLARLLATALIQWVDATTEFLGRLERDLSEVRRVFFCNRDLGDLIDVRSGLSDPHDGGRTVAVLTFRSGARLVYKPKTLALEAAYFRFVDWLNDLGSPLPFRCLTILDRGDYGWVEFVENLPCNTELEVERFYRRSGMFLSLVYVFNGIDFHFENVIACGEHPVPIDLETIYHHAPEVFAEAADPVDPAAERLQDSVLRTEILPNPVRLNDRYYEISAIGRQTEEAQSPEMLTWKNVNADGMAYEMGEIPFRAAENIPSIGDRALDPTDHVGELVQGFQQMYRLLIERRQTLLAEESLFHQMFRHPARFLFRATAFYQSVLNKALNPDHLRDGADFSIQLDVLARKLLKSNERPHLWRLVREEAEALLHCDVPKFSARGDGTSLVLRSGEIVGNCFFMTAWASVERKLRGLGEEDLAWQVRLIEGAMDAYAAWRAAAPSAEPEAEEPEPLAAVPMLTKDELLECAMSLAREVIAAAIYADNGEPSWPVLNYVPEADRFAVQAISLDLYNGRCGLALFFAAVEQCRPGEGYRELTYATIAPVRRWLARAATRDIEPMGLGGFVGFPSLIYSLTRIGTFLGNNDLIAEAHRATSLIDQKLIDADKRLDVMGGVAGAILCLLACHGATGRTEVLEKAVACGQHLLARREPDKCGARTWATFANRHLTGFSHGAGGIAYALLRLFEKTGESEFLAAAKEAIDFESAEFVPAQNNWPDHRPSKGEGSNEARLAFKVAWCNGAPGIGLARLAGRHVFESAAVRRDIDAALTTTCQSHLLSRDHICCGNLGLVETLLVAGVALSQPEWTNEAVRMASRIAARAKRKGSFGITFANGFFNPTLFQGAAGVGYEFLRLACPDKITSVLVLE
jgi:type 2 lantibiotic biosynthesis protein LanM